MKYCIRMKDELGLVWMRMRRCMNKVLYKNEGLTRPGMDEDEKVNELSIV